MGDSEGLGDLITINIKISHSTTPIRVKKTIFVFELKQEIVDCCVGWPELPHRLFFRGQALKDYQRLSHYYIEEGHTLYLVGRQEISQFFSSSAEAISNPSPGTVTDRSSLLMSQLIARRYNPTPSILLPYSITNLSQQLILLREIFATFGNHAYNTRAFDCYQTNLIRRTSRWAALVHTTRPMLIDEVDECLMNISKLLFYLSVREELEQESVAVSGVLLCGLGIELLTLGHTILRTQLHYTWLDTRIGRDESVSVYLRRSQQHAGYISPPEQSTESQEELSDSDTSSDDLQIQI